MMNPRLDPATLRKSFRRWVMEHYRLFMLVWQEFRFSLLFTFMILLVASVILHEWYPLAPGQEPVDWSRAVYCALVMLTFNTALEFHADAPWFVKAVFYGMPALGLIAILDSFSRFTKIVIQRRNNRREWFESLAKVYRGHVVVCGLGQVGYGMVRKFYEAETPCVAIEKRENEYIPRAFSKNIPVIVGDVQHREVLEKAQIHRAKSIAAVTDNDLVNIEIALTAMKINPALKVTVRIADKDLGRMFEERFIDIYGETARRDRLEVDSPSDRAAHIFADAARVYNDSEVGRILGKNYKMLDLDVTADSPLLGTSLADLARRFGIGFALHWNSETKEFNWSPALETRLAPGDTIVAFGTSDALAGLPTSTFRHHVILCGLGQIGDGVIQDFLKSGTPFVIVERDEDNEYLAKARKLGLPIVTGDVRDPETLRRARVEQADAIVALTSDALVNLEVILMAQKLNRDIRPVLRMDDEDIANSIRDFFNVEAYSPLAQAAETYANVARERQDGDSFKIGDVTVASLVLQVQEGRKLEDESLEDLYADLKALNVIYYENADQAALSPESSLRLQSGGTLVAIGTSDDLSELKRRNEERRSLTGQLLKHVEEQMTIPREFPTWNMADEPGKSKT